MSEICPTCKQEKKLYQCAIDGYCKGSKQSLISYGCKDCLRKEITKTFGEEGAEATLDFITKTGED